MGREGERGADKDGGEVGDQDSGGFGRGGSSVAGEGEVQGEGVEMCDLRFKMSFLLQRHLCIHSHQKLREREVTLQIPCRCGINY